MAFLNSSAGEESSTAWYCRSCDKGAKRLNKTIKSLEARMNGVEEGLETTVDGVEEKLTEAHDAVTSLADEVVRFTDSESCSGRLHASSIVQSPELTSRNHPLQSYLILLLRLRIQRSVC